MDAPVPTAATEFVLTYAPPRARDDFSRDDFLRWTAPALGLVVFFPSLAAMCALFVLICMS